MIPFSWSPLFARQVLQSATFCRYGGYDEYDDNLGDYYEPADGYTGEWRCMLTSNRQHDLLLKIRAACDL